MRPETRTRLEAFVARVDQLRSYSILKDPAHVARLTVRWHGENPEIEFQHPTDEATDAALLHIRVLIQRDDISIGRMAELYDDPGLSDEWKQEHGRMRDWLNGRFTAKGTRGPELLNVTFADLSFPGMELSVAKAICPEALPLVFGRWRVQGFAELPEERLIHPVA